MKLLLLMISCHDLDTAINLARDFEGRRLRILICRSKGTTLLQRWRLMVWKPQFSLSLYIFFPLSYCFIETQQGRIIVNGLPTSIRFGLDNSVSGLKSNKRYSTFFFINYSFKIFHTFKFCTFSISILISFFPFIYIKFCTFSISLLIKFFFLHILKNMYIFYFNLN